MKYTATIFLFLFSMCSSNHNPQDDFAGSFSGKNDGISSSAKLTVNDGRLKGTIIMNGKEARLSGSIDGTSTRGTLFDNELDKEYKYTGSLNGDELAISIKFPELKNRIIDLVMQRKSSSSANRKPESSSKESNPDLVGVWKYTEVLSTGSGENYYALTTEFFLELRENGTALTWTGKSAGAGDRESEEANPDKGEWHTEGKTLHLSDGSDQSVAFQYSVDESRMLLTRGSDKKIYKRVR